MSDLLGPSGNRMNTLSRLGLLFGATGAGLQGQLPQFQQSLMAQQDAIRQRLQQEQQQQALQALVTPRQIGLAGQVFGGTAPTQQEQMAINLLRAGRTQEALQFGNPQYANLLKGPQAPVALAQGAILADPITGAKIAENPAEPKKDYAPGDYGAWQRETEAGRTNLPFLQWVAQKEAATRAPEAPKEKDTFGDAAKLRSEFDGKTKEFAITRDAYASVSTAANDPSPAGDISLIFSYMKMLDPTSSVKEGEYATAQNAASVPETLRAKYRKVMDGETLTPQQRADFVNQAGNLYKTRLENFGREYKRYSYLAEQYGLNPANVVYDRSEGVGLNQGTKVLKWNPATGLIE